MRLRTCSRSPKANRHRVDREMKCNLFCSRSLCLHVYLLSLFRSICAGLCRDLWLCITCVVYAVQPERTPCLGARGGRGGLAEAGMAVPSSESNKAGRSHCGVVQRGGCAMLVSFRSVMMSSQRRLRIRHHCAECSHDRSCKCCSRC